jgi:hypothetical protein
MPLSIRPAPAGCRSPPLSALARLADFLQVEEQQQAQEEKKGKGKASGKRFEIKKWNAVAM